MSTSPIAHRSIKQNPVILGLAVAAIIALALVIVSSGEQPADPTDTRSCAQLEEDFEIYSTLISTHDRSWSQWEAVDAEKWAAYDQYHAKGCDN